MFGMISNSVERTFKVAYNLLGIAEDESEILALKSKAKKAKDFTKIAQELNDVSKNQELINKLLYPVE